MTFTYPLDLKYWLLNTLAGNEPIFAFGSIIVIAMLTAYFRMPGYIALIIIGIFIVMFAPFFEGLWIVVLLLAAVFVFYGIKNWINK